MSLANVVHNRIVYPKLFLRHLVPRHSRRLANQLAQIIDTGIAHRDLHKPRKSSSELVSFFFHFSCLRAMPSQPPGRHAGTACVVIRLVIRGVQRTHSMYMGITPFPRARNFMRLQRTAKTGKGDAHEVFVHHFRLPSRGEEMAHHVFCAAKMAALLRRAVRPG